MPWGNFYALLADLVLMVHVGIVVFVVGGLLLIVAGNIGRVRLGWVNTRWFRALHACAIAVVAAQAWLGVICPLTTLEMWLRLQAGQPTYGGSFIAHWLQALLYYDLPPWVFTLAYTLFALGVLAVWLLFPPVRSRRERRAG